jgi:hypothetical protein
VSTLLHATVYMLLHNSLNVLVITNNSVALVRERPIPTERPPLVDEVSDNSCG